MIKMIREIVQVILPIAPIRDTKKKKGKNRLKVIFPFVRHENCRGRKIRTRKFLAFCGKQADGQ